MAHYEVFYLGQFKKQFASRDAALAYIGTQPIDNRLDYEILDESDF